MTRKTLLASAAAIAIILVAVAILTNSQMSERENKLTTIITDIDAFVAGQNKNRGGALAGGGVLPLDYDALTGTVPAGGNAVTGISGIAASAPGITLPSGQTGNAVIIDGGISTAASTSGPDAYSLYVDATGLATVTDNNTGNSQTVSGASYVLFNGAATTSTGGYQSLYIVETGNAAVLASMYNAALGRVPDLPGLEFYIDQFGTAAVPDLHTAAIYFENSPEFKQDYPALQTVSDNGGPNDQAFITQLYSGILHRAPTASEMSFYIDYMQGTLSGETGPGNRADLLIYFANSPENQADIAASSGGWLINPANGAENFGALNSQAAVALLTKEVATGTVNAADFASVANSASQYSAPITTNGTIVGYVTVTGSETKIGGMAVAGAAVAVLSPNITVDLSSAINIAYVGGQNDIVNGAPGGGSLISVSSDSIGIAANYPTTVNLSGNANIISLGFAVNTNITTASVINGWNSTDQLHDSTAASTVVPLNLGILANTSAASVVAAANLTEPANQFGFIEAQDSAGDTFVYHWHTNTAGPIGAANIDGAVELVGIPASALIGANFN